MQHTCIVQCCIVNWPLVSIDSTIAGFVCATVPMIWLVQWTLCLVRAQIKKIIALFIYHLAGKSDICHEVY